ncbi:MAG: LytTR family DNA-binding domain-containing protein [Treponema sp.]|nr:LytTR family DNA-binding domain-containing protein [Treponema sp.]
MNVLICDDLPDAAVQLSKIISLSFSDADIRTFTDPAEALEFIRSGKIPDICFLDIIMPEIDGILLAEEMRKEGYGGPIVFLTSANNYAAQSYKVTAFSYLLKPPNASEVINLVLRAEKMRQESDTAGLQVKIKRLSRFILHREISWVEVKNQKVFFHLTDGSEVQMWLPLSKVVPGLLAESRFAKCHNAFVVNMDHISYIQGNTIFMKCGKNIPISKKYSDIKKLYKSRAF